MRNYSKPSTLSKNTIRAAWGMSIGMVVINALILTVVFPYIETSLGLYIPAKTGGKTFYIDQSEFLTISLISLTVVGALILLAHILHKKKKYEVSYLVATMVLTTGSIYLATILGNVFDELWGGAWSAVGVGAGISIGIVLAVITHAHRVSSRNKT